MVHAMSDRLHVFLFENLAIRGALVQLDETWREIRALRNYPPVLKSLLGESVVATALLSSTIKRSDGTLLMQMQGRGPVSLLVAECSSEYGLRCTARWTGAIARVPLKDLFGDGRCAITLGTGSGRPLYQGIVPLESLDLAAAIEDYMRRSEQLETRIWLFADDAAASGLLLQRIPEGVCADPDAFNRIALLSATVTPRELHSLSAPALLRRLFPEDDVRLFGGRPLHFACTCTRERVGTMLEMLGQVEVSKVVAERGQVDVTCEYCNRAYTFSAEQCGQLFASPPAAANSRQKH